jgi:NAD(P)-dependent dehydrogenase (short-subunit alcohol dehydrogenase family)
MKRAALLLGAAASLALAVALAFLATDVSRWSEALKAGDARYRADPDEPGLWRPDELAPRRLARDVLALDDDLAYRRAVQHLRLARLEGPSVTDPNLSLLRSDAQARLLEIVESDGDGIRRSAAANLMGVVALVSLVAEEQDRAVLLSTATRSFRRAIALDPSNEDAKYNLELSLQRGRELQLSEAAGGRDPAPGGRGSRGAGTGDPGSGY